MPRLNDRERPVISGAMVLLRFFGVVCWRQNSGVLLNPAGQPVRFGVPGLADIGGILPSGRAIQVETKRPGGGRLTANQRMFLEDVQKAGGVALVVSDLNMLAKALKILSSDPWAAFNLDGSPACPLGGSTS